MQVNAGLTKAGTAIGSRWIFDANPLSLKILILHREQRQIENPSLPFSSQIRAPRFYSRLLDSEVLALALTLSKFQNWALALSPWKLRIARENRRSAPYQPENDFHAHNQIRALPLSLHLNFGAENRDVSHNP